MKQVELNKEYFLDYDGCMVRVRVICFGDKGIISSYSTSNTKVLIPYDIWVKNGFNIKL
jgi:hypothetical protein